MGKETIKLYARQLKVPTFNNYEKIIRQLSPDTSPTLSHNFVSINRRAKKMMSCALWAMGEREVLVKA